MTNANNCIMQQQQQKFQQHCSLLAGKLHLPIDDFHLLENPSKYSHEEKQLRIKLTAVYRLIELNGWSMGIYNHATVKLGAENPIDQQTILIHPFGLHYNEITASSVLKIQLKTGKVIDQGSTNFELNWPGFIFHSAIHLSRPELKCVIHLHYPPVSAVSASRVGLLPICQEQALLGKINYLDYTGIPTEEEEREAVAQAFGKDCKVMLLRNHGLIVAGETIEEAYYLLSNLMRACESQARLLAIGGFDNVVLMSEEASRQAYETVQNSRYPIRQLSTNVTTTTNELFENSKANSQAINTKLTRNTSFYDDGDNCSSTSGNESDLESTSSAGSNNKVDLIVQVPNQQQQMQQQSYAQNRRYSSQQNRKNIIGYVNMFELDFEAQMRSLDLAGHQTGYAYKRPLIRNYKL